jgi:hypothetical protein
MIGEKRQLACGGAAAQIIHLQNVVCCTIVKGHKMRCEMKCGWLNVEIMRRQVSD